MTELLSMTETLSMTKLLSMTELLSMTGLLSMTESSRILVTIPAMIQERRQSTLPLASINNHLQVED
jgi:hypothetical protein